MTTTMPTDRHEIEQRIARDLAQCDLGLATTTGKVRRKYLVQKRACLRAIAEMNAADGLGEVSDEELLRSLSGTADCLPRRGRKEDRQMSDNRELVLESLLKENADTFRYLLGQLPAEMRNERRICECSIGLAEMMLSGPYRRPADGVADQPEAKDPPRPRP